ncbi:MAG: hypothetical protein Q4B43_00700 [Bacteroidota bacterium]|nr:hypothetical protein [Bacteroidota bacterium]
MGRIIGAVVFLVSFSFFQDDRKLQIEDIDFERCCVGYQCVSVQGNSEFREKKHIISSAVWHVFRETISKKSVQEDGSCSGDMDQGYVSVVKTEELIKKYSI